MRRLTLIVIVLCIRTVLPVPVSINQADDNGPPREIQHATCKVFTKDLEATAKATITRQLKGICSLKELNSHFNYIQSELQNIKNALSLIYGQTIQYNVVTVPPTIATSFNQEYLDYSEKENFNKKLNSSLKLLEANKYAKVKDEVKALNDTVVESSEGDLYFYYWKITEITRVLNKRGIYIVSPTFSVLGHTLRLQFYPNYMEGVLGVLLKPESSSFVKKHKIIILGQKDTQNQITSKVILGLKTEENMLKVQQEMIDSNFVVADTLLIKLKLYLQL